MREREYAYGEQVRLIMPRHEPRDLTLADAVTAVVQHNEPVERLGAIIIRDRAPIDRYSLIKAIYDRPDFPK